MLDIMRRPNLKCAGNFITAGAATIDECFLDSTHFCYMEM